MIYFIISILLSLMALSLGGFVFLNNPRAVANRFYVGLVISGAIWLIANAFSVSANPTVAIIFAYLITPSSLLALMFFCYFSLFFPRRIVISSTILKILALPAIVMVPLSFTSLNLSTSVLDNVAVIQLGPMYPAYLAAAISYTLLGIAYVWRKHKHSTGLERVQLGYLGIGITLTAIPALIIGAVLPAFGYEALSGFTPYFALFFLGLTALAIVRHRLFDVRLVVARAVAYAALLLTLAALYGLVIFTISALAFPASQLDTTERLVDVALAILLAFTFQPLKRFFEHVTDSIFFRDRYDSQVVLNQVGRILVGEFQLDKLLQRTLKEICQELNIATGQLYIFDQDHLYKVEHYGDLPPKLITAPHLKLLRHRVVVSDELAGGREKDIMQEFGYRVILHLHTKEEFVGYLLLGDKLSGDIYTAQDIALLEILVQELAVAISNSKAYEDIAAFNLTLQQKIDDATKKLKVANQNLRELDEAKDEFISMASHQLRTPLTSIKGYLSMVLEGDTGKITAQQTEFLTYAFTGAQRTVNMISDLLNVSRMTAGKFFIEKSEVDLGKLVAEEVQQLQQMAESRKLTLKFTPPKKPLPLMQLDEGKTRQVVMNFVDNALHYTQKGEVVVSLQQVAKSAELRVKDSGIGVPKAAREHLFSKFFRADNAQTARPDGTGLGLFLAKRVIEDQGGTIIFESIEGKGSTFGFSMPLNTKESRGNQRPPGK